MCRFSIYTYVDMSMYVFVHVFVHRTVEEKIYKILR